MALKKLIKKSQKPAPIKISNPKIGLAFVEELEGEPAYQNVKAFSATHAFLRKVLYFCRDEEFAQIKAEKIKEWFENFDVDYKPCLIALERHGIIESDHHYIVNLKSKGYRLTEKGARLLSEGQMQYLNQIFKDKAIKRKLQKQASYNKKQPKKYKHEFLEYIHEGLMSYTFSEDVLKHIEKSDWGPLTKLKAMMNLTTFAERDFTDLKYNKTDTRCWNEFAGMKSDLRRFFGRGDLKYRHVMDIRSCHPLFLAHYLVHKSQPMGIPLHPITPFDPADPNFAKNFPSVKLSERERSERSSNTNSTTITNPSTTTPPSSNPTNTTKNNSKLHYDGGNSDIQAELVRWNSLFSDPTTDPKTVLIRELGYTREQAKTALNHSINGSRQYGKFLKWFKGKFPKLFAVWDRTDKREVGVEISSYYETQLMQDLALYKLADELGLHLTYEFDGCGVMCRVDDTEALAKIRRLIAHIQDHSERLWGIRPVLVVKTATGEAVNTQVPTQKRATDATEALPQCLCQ